MDNAKIVQRFQLNALEIRNETHLFTDSENFSEETRSQVIDYATKIYFYQRPPIRACDIFAMRVFRRNF